MPSDHVETAPPPEPIHGEPNIPDPAATATPRALRPGDPGYAPRPGDPDYAPPARIAQPAGVVLEGHHYDYNPGIGSGAVGVNGQSPLAMPAPAYETVTTDSLMIRPSQLSTQSATIHLRKMVGDMRAWIGDFSHPVSGELAVVVQFFRDLNARRAALNTAAQLGRTVEPDEIDKAEHVPPQEFFQLRHMAASLMHAMAIYDRALTDVHGALSKEDAASLDSIKAEFGPLADGPQNPDEADIHPDDETPPLTANSPETHSANPAPPAVRVRQPAAERSNRIADTQPQQRVVEGQPTPPDAPPA